MSTVIGRFYWGSGNKDDEYQFPGPWVSFKNVTEYRKWAREVRKLRPKNSHGKRTVFEYAYIDQWSAENLLTLLSNQAGKERD